jgi:hypothetical protein
MHNSFELLAEQLRTDGFALLPGLLPIDIIDRHLNEYQPFYTSIGDGPSEGWKSLSRDQQMEIRRKEREYNRYDAVANALIYQAGLTDFLRFYFGEEPVAAEPLTGLYSRATSTHNDSTGFLVTSPRGSRLRLWGALEDITEESGPFYIIPKSHLLMSRTLEDEILQEHPQFVSILRQQLNPTSLESFFIETQPIFDVLEAKFQKVLTRDGLYRHVPALKKGDAIIFDVDLVHGTMPILNPGSTRKHLLCYWSSLSSRFYPPRAYFGNQHDYRNSAPPIDFRLVKKTSGGMHIDNWEQGYRDYPYASTVVPS